MNHTRPKISTFPKCYLEDICAGRMDLFEWITMSKDLGAQGVELYDGFLSQKDDEYLDKVRAAIHATDQVSSLYCFSSDFTHPDPQERAAELQRQKQAIDCAAALGASYCRILSGQRRPNVGRADGIRWVVENIRSALEYAAERGIGLAIENHYKDGIWNYPEFAQRADVFLEIVNQIEAPHFGVQFDPSNAVVAGDDPVALLEAVKHRVVSMHASDRYLAEGKTLEDMRQEDGTLGYPEFLLHGVTGQGTNDYDAFFRILRSVDFAGWISIEDGMNGLDDMRASVDFLKTKIDEHYGPAPR